MDQQTLVQLTIKKLMDEATEDEQEQLKHLIAIDAFSAFFVETLTAYFSRQHQHSNVDAARLFERIRKKITNG
jgi:hypothetical protein